MGEKLKRPHPNLFVHKFDEKGRVASESNYIRHVTSGVVTYEKPPQSGHYYNEDWTYNEKLSVKALHIAKERAAQRRIEIEKELQEIEKTLGSKLEETKEESFDEEFTSELE